MPLAKSASPNSTTSLALTSARRAKTHTVFDIFFHLFCLQAGKMCKMAVKHVVKLAVVLSDADWPPGPLVAASASGYTSTYQLHSQLNSNGPSIYKTGSLSTPQGATCWVHLLLWSIQQDTSIVHITLCSLFEAVPIREVVLKTTIMQGQKKGFID